MDLWLGDPDPRIRDLASVAFLDEVIGRGFLERWARMNDCEEWMAQRLRELERENGRPKRAVADLTLDKLILEEAAKGSY